MEAHYPALEFDLARDRFVVWVRWVSRERPPSPEAPANQGVRVELQLNRNPVLGPLILWRRDLEAQPVYLASNRRRTQQILRAADGKHLDIQLVAHGSVAHAAYLALYHLRDYRGLAIATEPVRATPLLQLLPSVPADRWHIAGQANLRAQVRCAGVDTELLVLD